MQQYLSLGWALMRLACRWRLLIANRKYQLGQNAAVPAMLATLNISKLSYLQHAQWPGHKMSRRSLKLWNADCDQQFCSFGTVEISRTILNLVFTGDRTFPDASTLWNALSKEINTVTRLSTCYFKYISLTSSSLTQIQGVKDREK